MLTRTHRFHGRDSLDLVYRRGAVVRGAQLGLRYILNTQHADYRLAVIVSRKVHKSAVARNRLRRRIYEIIRTGPAVMAPYDLVVTVFSDQVSALSPADLTRAVQRLLQKAGVWVPASHRSTHDIVKPEKG